MNYTDISRTTQLTSSDRWPLVARQSRSPHRPSLRSRQLRIF
ncbi:MAG: hypothetical protein GDA48_13765 [Hormoscilla sp. GM102CHS1]|nr:hypothetical protein [Hormoscilla sp. GM102CHS1]